MKTCPHRALCGLITGLAAVAGAFGMASAVTIPEVIDMLEADVGESIILRQLETDQSVLYLTTRDIIELKEAGASDRFIEILLDVEEEHRTARETADAPKAAENSWNSDFDQWNRPYDEANRSVSITYEYDPFGYHWYASPVYYAYYYPYRSWDIGFYYAGWHNWRWWGWHGYWNSVWWDRCNYWYPHVTYYSHHNPHHYGYSDHWKGDRYKSQGQHGWDRGDRRNGTRVDLDRGRDRSRTRTYTDRSDAAPKAARPAPDRSGWDRNRDRTPRDRGDRTRTYTPPRSDSRPPSTQPSRPSTRGGGSRSEAAKGGGSSGGDGSRGGWRR